MQVLAASKNKISTLKGFPHLPVLEVSIQYIKICVGAKYDSSSFSAHINLL